MADAEGRETEFVKTPPSFGCNEAEPAVMVLERALVHCRIRGATVYYSRTCFLKALSAFKSA